MYMNEERFSFISTKPTQGLVPIQLTTTPLGYRETHWVSPYILSGTQSNNIQPQPQDPTLDLRLALSSHTQPR